MAVVERTSNVLQLLWRGYKKAAFEMSQRCATVHREAHASASPRLYLQAALFRAQMEREEKNQCWLSPSLQIQLYVWHRKLTKNCNLEKKILLWAPTQTAAKPTGCLFYHKLFQVTMDQDAKHSQVEISLDVTRVSTLPSSLIYWGRHRPSRQNNTPAAPTPGSARATRTETWWVLQASERRSSHSTPATLSRRLPSTAPSPPSYTPLLPKADLLLMKSLPQDSLECDRMRKGRESRKRRGRSKRWGGFQGRSFCFPGLLQGNALVRFSRT